MRNPKKPLRILTWHVHGNYLYYLTQVPHDFYLATDSARSTHYTGRSGTLPWGSNVHEAPVERLHEMEFDVILFQSRDAWEAQERLLSPAQRRLPRVYLEHDPPQEHPTDTLHWAGERDVLLVHVTAFNALMWNSGEATTRVVEHGVLPLANARYGGERESGLVVVNNLDLRGRRLGHDVYAALREEVPLVLVGMGSERIPGGEGEVANAQLPEFMAHYRFFFNPIRYTSLGLAIIEAMMVGLPIVGLATTELVTVIRNGENGFIATDPQALVEPMRHLLRDREAARALGEAGRQTALERFNIERFIADWLATLDLVAR
ncbi:MAG: glycosyltransferase family 4 protein [Betaproteobacteria bacterium]